MLLRSQALPARPAYTAYLRPSCYAADRTCYPRCYATDRGCEVLTAGVERGGTSVWYGPRAAVGTPPPST
eukprot:3348389-Rhodomonas_salina.1